MSLIQISSEVDFLPKDWKVIKARYGEGETEISLILSPAGEKFDCLLKALDFMEEQENKNVSRKDELTRIQKLETEDTPPALSKVAKHKRMKISNKNSNNMRKRITANDLKISHYNDISEKENSQVKLFRSMIVFLGQVIFMTIPICIPILDYSKVNRLNLDLLKFAIFIHSKQTTFEQSFGILQEVKFHIWVFWDRIFTAILKVKFLRWVFWDGIFSAISQTNTLVQIGQHRLSTILIA